MYTQNDQRGRIITDKHLIKSEITFRIFIRLWCFRWSRGLYLSKNSFECSLSNVLSILRYSTTSTDLGKAAQQSGGVGMVRIKNCEGECKAILLK